MSTIEPQEEDVIYTVQQTIAQAETFRVKDLLPKVLEQLRSSQKLLVDGIVCRYLSTSGGGWIPGTLRLHICVRLEFVPKDSPSSKP